MSTEKAIPITNESVFIHQMIASDHDAGAPIFITLQNNFNYSAVIAIQASILKKFNRAIGKKAVKITSKVVDNLV